ncbi:MAG: hypothetical protein H6734_08645 [Alphaproteobacteria bacterium]|nr:hypothetical protein [Alphaproteobacteria bacterium]
MSVLSVHVVVVGGPGEDVAEQLAVAGHTVTGPTPAADDTLAIAGAVRGAPGADVVVVVGGCGPRGAFPEALDHLEGRRVPGYGERARSVATEALDIAAMGVRAEAAFVDDVLVFGVPNHAEAAHEVVARVLLPGIPVLFPVDGAEDVFPATPEPTDTPDAPAPRDARPTPATPTRSLSLGLGDAAPSAPAPEEAAEVPSRGWLAAVSALRAEVHLGRREDLPEPIENLAPVVNVLHTAGEIGTMRLPSGRRYGLYGWPDLRRPGSKVVAVSWGEPLAEMVVLHRHPHPVGTTIDEGLGLLPPSDSDVEDAAVRATGRAPPDCSGRLFALESDAIWILRERRVFKWDGQRLRDDGSPKQVLASLTLRWSNH